MNILLNQCKYPGIYNECFSLGCSKDLRSSFANNDNVNDNVNYNDNVNDLRSSVANNVKDNDNDLRSSFTNNDNNNDNVNDNDTVNDNDNFIYLFDEKHQWGKPNNKECLSNIISVNINEDLQSWLKVDNIITEATLPENFRCLISGPGEYGKTFILKKLILARIYFDRLYIIGPTADQYEGVERYNRRSRNSVDDKADVEFVKGIKIYLLPINYLNT